MTPSFVLGGRELQRGNQGTLLLVPLAGWHQRLWTRYMMCTRMEGREGGGGRKVKGREGRVGRKGGKEGREGRAGRKVGKEGREGRKGLNVEVVDQVKYVIP